MEDSGYRVVWELHNHIVGKVYALDQKNMNAMIRDIEALVKEKAQISERLEQLTMDVSRLKVQNDKYREALERIENECSRHDTTAWSIASDALEALKGDITTEKGEEEPQWMTKDEFNMHFKMMYSEERMKNYKVWNHRTGEYEPCNIFEDLQTAKIAPIEKDKE